MNITEDARKYCEYLSQARDRLNVIKWAVAEVRILKHETFFHTELIFIQFRKVLEAIAFASLTAHRDKYAAVHTDMGQHWNAIKLIKGVEGVNPEFYPQPFLEPKQLEGRSFHLENQTAPFLTKEDFIKLYSVAGEILHTQNPFAGKSEVTDIKHSVDDWGVRIEALIRWHSVKLLDNVRWLIHVPEVGDVHAVILVPSRGDEEVPTRRN